MTRRGSVLFSFAWGVSAFIFMGLSAASPNTLGPESASGLNASGSADIEAMEFFLAEPPGEESPIRKVELVVLEAGNQRTVRVGFHVELEPGWHLYWANPGDAGIAPSVRWTLPPGFTAGPLRHPVPEKAVEDGIISFEHTGDVLLLCEITAAPSYRDGEPWEAAAVFEWMACRDSCVTGETAVRAVFPPDAESLAGGRSLAERFASRFPRPLAEAGLTAGTGRAEWTGKAWRVEIPLGGERAAEASDFFASPLEDFVIDNAAVTCRDGKISLRLVPSAGPASPPPSAVSGIVILDGLGYEVSAPVSARRQRSGLFEQVDRARISEESWIPRDCCLVWEQPDPPSSHSDPSISRSVPNIFDLIAALAASWTHSLGSWR